jgi:hypothetical protein
VAVAGDVAGEHAIVAQKRLVQAGASNRAPRRNTNNQHQVQIPELPRLSQATTHALDGPLNFCFGATGIPQNT